MNRNRRIAQRVEHRARVKMYEDMAPGQRRALRLWVGRACAYSRLYPDAGLDEVRAAVRALEGVPLDPFARYHAGVTEEQANDRVQRICAEVRRDYANSEDEPSAAR